MVSQRSGLSGAAGPFVIAESLSTSGAVSQGFSPVSQHQRCGLSAVGGLSTSLTHNLIEHYAGSDADVETLDDTRHWDAYLVGADA